MRMSQASTRGKARARKLDGGEINLIGRQNVERGIRRCRPVSIRNVPIGAGSVKASPLNFCLGLQHPAARAADCTAADILFEQMPNAPILHGDKVYDSNAVRPKIVAMSAAPNIPPGQPTLEDLFLVASLSRPQRH